MLRVEARRVAGEELRGGEGLSYNNLTTNRPPILSTHYSLSRAVPPGVWWEQNLSITWSLVTSSPWVVAFSCIVLARMWAIDVIWWLFIAITESCLPVITSHNPTSTAPPSRPGSQIDRVGRCLKQFILLTHPPLGVLILASSNCNRWHHLVFCVSVSSVQSVTCDHSIVSMMTLITVCAPR